MDRGQTDRVARAFFQHPRRNGDARVAGEDAADEVAPRVPVDDGQLADRKKVAVRGADRRRIPADLRRGAGAGDLAGDRLAFDAQISSESGTFILNLSTVLGRY